MTLSFLYRLVRHVAEFLRIHHMDAVAKDAGILVLRQQLAILRREVTGPRFSRSEQAIAAVLGRLVPQDRWAAFLISPETILRWHRALVRRNRTFPHRRSGRPRLSEETVEPIVRLIRENPVGCNPRIPGLSRAAAVVG